MANYEANWVTNGRRLCCGKWIIRRNGVDVSELIPKSLREDHMNTHKQYDVWYFTESYDEGWGCYFTGLTAKKWVRKNHYWISKICSNREEEFQLYHAINAADWRHWSC
jgi:hypothetical protein